MNPPYLAPMTELVPAPWTSEGTRTRARAIMNEVGQVPVSLTKELPGFVLNRIQVSQERSLNVNFNLEFNQSLFTFCEQNGCSRMDH